MLEMVVPAISLRSSSFIEQSCADVLRILLSAHARATRNVFIGVIVQNLQFGTSRSSRSQNFNDDELGHTFRAFSPRYKGVGLYFFDDGSCGQIVRTLFTAEFFLWGCLSRLASNLKELILDFWVTMQVLGSRRDSMRKNY